MPVTWLFFVIVGGGTLNKMDMLRTIRLLISAGEKKGDAYAILASFASAPRTEFGMCLTGRFFIERNYMGAEKVGMDRIR